MAAGDPADSVVETPAGAKAPVPAAETKRLAARRQFLKGAGAALPFALTFGRRQAHAAGLSTCYSIRWNFQFPPSEGELSPTNLCTPIDGGPVIGPF